MTAHTILLIQSTPRKTSRTFTDHESVQLAIEEILRMFETQLKELNMNTINLSYGVEDLYTFIDRMADLCALVFDPNTKAYIPRDKEWIKRKIYAHFQRNLTQTR